MINPGTGIPILDLAGKPFCKPTALEADVEWARARLAPLPV